MEESDWLAWLKTERGVHVETMLYVDRCAAALAGHGPRRSAAGRIRAMCRCRRAWDASVPAAALAEHLPQPPPLMVCRQHPNRGEAFYFGDLINGYIVPQATNGYSLWNFVAAAAIEAGLNPTELPDYREQVSCSPPNRSARPSSACRASPGNISR